MTGFHVHQTALFFWSRPRNFSLPGPGFWSVFTPPMYAAPSCLPERSANSVGNTDFYLFWILPRLPEPFLWIWKISRSVHWLLPVIRGFAGLRVQADFSYAANWSARSILCSAEEPEVLPTQKRFRIFSRIASNPELPIFPESWDFMQHLRIFPGLLWRKLFSTK